MAKSGPGTLLGHRNQSDSAGLLGLSDQDCGMSQKGRVWVAVTKGRMEELAL